MGVVYRQSNFAEVAFAFKYYAGYDGLLLFAVTDITVRDSQAAELRGHLRGPVVIPAAHYHYRLGGYFAAVNYNVAVVIGAKLDVKAEYTAWIVLVQAASIKVVNVVLQLSFTCQMAQVDFDVVGHPVVIDRKLERPGFAVNRFNSRDQIRAAVDIAQIRRGVPASAALRGLNAGNEVAAIVFSRKRNGLDDLISQFLGYLALVLAINVFKHRHGELAERKVVDLTCVTFQLGLGRWPRSA